MGNGVGTTVGSGVWVGSSVADGTLPTLPEKTCALSGCLTVRANTLSSDTSAIALDVVKSTVVGRVSQAPPWGCWMEMFSPYPPANVVSAALSSTAMAMGFSSGESVLMSKALPVAVNLGGRVGMSAISRAE